MKKLLDQNINRLWASLIIDELVKQGAEHFYCSPGMRNAPFLSVLSARNDVQLHSVIDERSAAFCALGQSKTSGIPSVLLCTSGTAAANYYPAIIEASKTNSPLIVLTADRPAHIVMVDDNQTIWQRNLFGQFCSPTIELGPPSESVSPAALTRAVSSLYLESINGPVHFNQSFDEPLDGTIQPIDENYLRQAEKIFNQSSPKTRKLKPITSLPSEILELIEASTTPLLVIGGLKHSLEKGPIRELINHWPGLVNLDITSELKYEFPNNEKIIPSFDHPEVFQAISQTKPDLVVHLGARSTSKFLYRFLKANPPKELWNVSSSKHTHDPSFETTLDICICPAEFADALNTKLSSERKFNFETGPWMQKKAELIESGPMSIPLVSKTLIENIPNESLLVIGNSTAIRSFDYYLSHDTSKSLSVISQRGASGIEGHISTALGVSHAQDKDVYLVLGDIAFMHDLNALALLSSVKRNIKIIVLNNRCGGIFHLDRKSVV